MTGIYKNADGSIYKVWRTQDNKSKSEIWHALCIESQTKTTNEAFIIDILKWKYLIDINSMILQ
jgi:hypothetical protein